MPGKSPPGIGSFTHLLYGPSKAPLWTRLKLAWNVLRDRPTGYKLDIHGTLNVRVEGTMVVRCHFHGRNYTPLGLEVFNNEAKRD